MITNFDSLKALHDEARRFGSGGTAQFVKFATAIFDSFPLIYHTAKRMNEEMKTLRTADKSTTREQQLEHALRELIATIDLVGTWIDASQDKPDSDTTVFVSLKNDPEPVWLGYHDGDVWRSIEGTEIEVIAWSDMPEAAGRPVTEVEYREG